MFFTKSLRKIFFSDSFLLFTLWLLLFWAKSWEAHPLQDAMTYGALAKHLLEGPDWQSWKTLNYSNQAYSNFYQHPPLGIWISALVFKALGANDWTLRISPSFFSLASLWLVYYWGGKSRQEGEKPHRSLGFLGGLVLLSSSRFIKYGGTLLLDVFLAFWFMLFAYFLSQSLNFINKNNILKYYKKNNYNLIILSFGLASSFFMAFLTKGMPALLLPALHFFFFLLTTLCACSTHLQLLAFLLYFWIPTGGLFASWFYFGGGAVFLPHYWTESVAPRFFLFSSLFNGLSGGFNGSHLALIKNLIQVYQPWWALLFFFLTCYIVEGVKLLLKLFFRKKEGSEYASFFFLSRRSVLACFILGILLGYGLSGNFFLEHYSLILYPFSALLIAEGIVGWGWRGLEFFHKKLKYALNFLIVIYALLILCFPISVHRRRGEEAERQLLKKAAQICTLDGLNRIYLDPSIVEPWRGLALALWYLPKDAAVLKPPKLASPGGELYLLSRSLWEESSQELQLLGWEKTAIFDSKLLLLQRSGLNTDQDISENAKAKLTQALCPSIP